MTSFYGFIKMMITAELDMTTADSEELNLIEVSLSFDFSVLGGRDFRLSVILFLFRELLSLLEKESLHSSELSSVEMYSDDSAWL
jgi:hypothetical protein